MLNKTIVLPHLLWLPPMIFFLFSLHETNHNKCPENFFGLVTRTLQTGNLRNKGRSVFQDNLVVLAHPSCYFYIMGIAKEAYFLLSKLSKSNVFHNKSVLQLGRQSGIISIRQISKISNRLNLGLELSKLKGSGFYRNYPSGDELFRSLGFSKIDSLDVTSYEGANVLADLNQSVDNLNLESYDLVYDGGTSEHIFNQMEVLTNIFKILKVGGIVIHNTPANNLLDHGYVQASPNFYLEYYTANQFELLQSHLIESDWDFFRKRKIYNYNQLSFNYLSYGGHWNSKMLQNWFAFRKTDKSTFGVIPQQARYTELLYKNIDSRPSTNRIYKRIRTLFRNHPNLMFIVLQSKHWFNKFSSTPSRYLSRKRPKVIWRV